MKFILSVVSYRRFLCFFLRMYGQSVLLFCYGILLRNICIVFIILYMFCVSVIEGLHERTEHLDIFLFSTYHSVVFYFRCSVYWWKGSIRF